MRSIPLLLAGFALVAPALARATCPAGATSQIPTCIAVVGSTGGVVDPAGEFTVTVHDEANNPCPDREVLVDFGAYGGFPNDVRISATQPFPGQTVVGNAVRRITDAAGVARFRILGGAHNLGNSPGIGAGGAHIIANGVLLGGITVQAFDQDLVSGVGANDLSLWLSDKFAPGAPYYGRSDYDCNGSLGANDLSIWVGFKFAGGSATSAPPPFIP
jgi:hypothetical protein